MADSTNLYSGIDSFKNQQSLKILNLFSPIFGTEELVSSNTSNKKLFSTRMLPQFTVFTHSKLFLTPDSDILTGVASEATKRCNKSLLYGIFSASLFTVFYLNLDKLVYPVIVVTLFTFVSL